MEDLRRRILTALSADPDTLRVVNVGALEEELWTDDEWCDEYGAALDRELAAMEADGLLASARVFGETAYHLAGDQP
jgi:hypothetical protein